MSRRKPRKIRQDEIDLWAKVVEHAVPLYPTRPLVAEKQSLTPPKPAFSPVPRFRLGETAKAAFPAHNLARPIVEQLAQQPVAMDRKRFAKMKRGRISPEARIDLHGMTTAQAHPALTRFILDAVSEDRRLVLVITGKGKTRADHGPIPERHGVLRHQVPHWLHTPPLKAHILQVSDAHVKHGGHGAYYVYLRRNR
ncbi:Smr/MutS family protein [Maritimibacter sp. HL-12]|uniref:Smr/MutS family protein n=1 Tax=Maritimibacter sp. HL-12 TaxID=1162418 RepID=UPI000A0F03CA|nr:Smr/MutS family protein [Maritimibacter sp. HL-12]SMH45149.1 DNA-nicking endonuclease, Smr domain [Maritimibacter sp. HL-12]